MRSLGSLLLLLAASACRERDEVELSYWGERKAEAGTSLHTERKTKLKVIDQAGRLSEPEQARIDREAIRVGTAIDRDVVVLTIPPLGKQSLEQFGWAINGQRRSGGTVMLMVRPDERVVRVDSGGGVTPEQAAQVASAMRPDLESDRVAEAIHQGLRTLQQVAGKNSG